MNAIIAVLSFIIVLSIIVIVHEFGHFVTAKKFGVYCTEFSIGMGPAIYQRRNDIFDPRFANRRLCADGRRRRRRCGKYPG